MSARSDERGFRYVPTCERCNETLSPGDRFCQHCGAPVSRGESESGAA
ncbi:MAG: zinc-ribbon domain-containing protein, partial [Pseudorhodoplanes sp.]|nr:zinc-ribbon domain-containing protein [Pseudorhodoplanes sp.]